MAKRIIIGLALVAGLSACNAEKPSHTSSPHLVSTYAAHLQATAGNEGKQGTVYFEQNDKGVVVRAQVTGLPANSIHGFHVHEYGDCSASDATSAGSHFNPLKMSHGGPEHSERHVGDLGNIESNAQGVAVVELNDSHLHLHGDTSILGRAVVVHAKADDLTSQPVGNAGARVLCGVIGVVKKP